jgi:3-oxoacyl-[acyl-carrier protein] reductase
VGGGSPSLLRSSLCRPRLKELLRNYIERVSAEEGISFDEKRAGLVNDSALKIPSTPEDLANLALFLASDQARTITGQCIAVDAGHAMMG